MLSQKRQEQINAAINKWIENSTDSDPFAADPSGNPDLVRQLDECLDQGVLPDGFDQSFGPVEVFEFIARARNGKVKIDGHCPDFGPSPAEIEPS